MGKRINVEPFFLGTSSANLLNGALASLSGPIGFSLTQPRITVKSISITNTDDNGWSFYPYKGASEGSAAGTMVLSGGVEGLQTSVFPMDDLVLDATDFLTGYVYQSGGGNKPAVSISAEIDFN